MKYAMIHGPRDVRVEEADAPCVGPEDALVRVKACGICGSDVHRYLGTRFGLRLKPYPLNSGHEYCGDVVRVGENVKRVKAGDKVVLGLNWVSDGMGAFSEYVRIPQVDRRQQIQKVPDEISYEEGAVIEPLFVALNGFSQLKPTADERVLILGGGPIGLLLLQRCRSEGIGEVILSEVSLKRLGSARGFGAIGVNPMVESLEEKVRTLTEGRGVDATFECAGAPVTTEQALSCTRPRGRICLIAHYAKNAQVDPETIVSKGLNVQGYGGGTPFDEAVRLIIGGEISIKPLISHEFPLEKVKEAFETASRPDISLKVLIKP